MTMELNENGFMLDTNLAYIFLSWQLLIITALLFVGYKAYKIWRKK